jgi:hypothetical protein
MVTTLRTTCPASVATRSWVFGLSPSQTSRSRPSSPAALRTNRSAGAHRAVMRICPSSGMWRYSM